MKSLQSMLFGFWRNATPQRAPSKLLYMRSDALIALLKPCWIPVPLSQSHYKMCYRNKHPCEMKKLRATLSCGVRRRGYSVHKECHWCCYMYTPLFVIGQGTLHLCPQTYLHCWLEHVSDSSISNSIWRQQVSSGCHEACWRFTQWKTLLSGTHTCSKQAATLLLFSDKMLPM